MDGLDLVIVNVIYNEKVVFLLSIRWGDRSQKIFDVLLCVFQCINYLVRE